MVKKIRKSEKIAKNYFFLKKFFFLKKKKNFDQKKKKNAILLVFQYQEDGIRPELSSPPRFRIQGGSPERDGVGGVVGVAGRHFSFLIQDQKVQPATRAYFQLLRRASAFGRGFFCPSGKKKSLLCCFGPFLAIFGVQQ